MNHLPHILLVLTLAVVGVILPAPFGWFMLSVGLLSIAEVLSG